MIPRPWLSHYDPGVPASLAPYPERTLLDYLAETARARPELAALVFKGTRISAARLEELSDAFAAALAGLGVRKGDRVALLLPNCPQFIIAELGAWKVGAIVAPLNPLYPADELAALLARIEPETVVVLTPYYHQVKVIQPATAVRRVIATSIKEYLPTAARLLFTISKESQDGHRVTIAGGDHWFHDLLERHAHAPRPDVAVGPDDIATLLPSGGTTGTPKAVEGAHRNAVITAVQVAAWLASVTEPERDVILLPLPLFHVFGMNMVQGFAFVRRLPLALVPNPRDVADLVATIRHERPAFFVGVPTLFNALLTHKDVRAGKVDFTSMKLCVSGAAPLLAETKRRFEELTRSTITEGYGLTETQTANNVNPVRGAQKIGSVGLPLPDVDVRIVDAADGARDRPLGEVGEIVVHCPQHTTGYWRNAAETAEVLRPGPDGRRWVYTGDLGYLDDDGYLFIVDRKKDLIKIGGFQVWPREIEEVIARHPAVVEVGVAAVPDPLRGEVAKAWVVLRAGARATPEEIRAFCREHLVAYKVPAIVTLADELPKSQVGKVLRRGLVERHAKEQG